MSLLGITGFSPGHVTVRYKAWMKELFNFWLTVFGFICISTYVLFAMRRSIWYQNDGTKAYCFLSGSIVALYVTFQTMLLLYRSMLIAGKVRGWLLIMLMLPLVISGALMINSAYYDHAASTHGDESVCAHFNVPQLVFVGLFVSYVVVVSVFTHQRLDYRSPHTRPLLLFLFSNIVTIFCLVVVTMLTFTNHDYANHVMIGIFMVDTAIYSRASESVMSTLPLIRSSAHAHIHMLGQNLHFNSHNRLYMWSLVFLSGTLMTTLLRWLARAEANAPDSDNLAIVLEQGWWSMFKLLQLWYVLDLVRYHAKGPINGRLSVGLALLTAFGLEVVGIVHTTMVSDPSTNAICLPMDSPFEYLRAMPLLLATVQMVSTFAISRRHQNEVAVVKWASAAAALTVLEHVISALQCSTSSTTAFYRGRTLRLVLLFAVSIMCFRWSCMYPQYLVHSRKILPLRVDTSNSPVLMTSTLLSRIGTTDSYFLQCLAMARDAETAKE